MPNPDVTTGSAKRAAAAAKRKAHKKKKAASAPVYERPAPAYGVHIHHTVPRGHLDPSVFRRQRVLERAGHPIVVDGVNGIRTRAAWNRLEPQLQQRLRNVDKITTEDAAILRGIGMQIQNRHGMRDSTDRPGSRSGKWNSEVLGQIGDLLHGKQATGPTSHLPFGQAAVRRNVEAARTLAVGMGVTSSGKKRISPDLNRQATLIELRIIDTIDRRRIDMTTGAFGYTDPALVARLHANGVGGMAALPAPDIDWLFRHDGIGADGRPTKRQWSYPIDINGITQWMPNRAYVRLLQQHANLFGEKLRVDGAFDSRTADALKRAGQREQKVVEERSITMISEQLEPSGAWKDAAAAFGRDGYTLKQAFHDLRHRNGFQAQAILARAAQIAAEIEPERLYEAKLDAILDAYSGTTIAHAVGEGGELVPVINSPLLDQDARARARGPFAGTPYGLTREAQLTGAAKIMRIVAGVPAPYALTNTLADLEREIEDLRTAYIETEIAIAKVRGTAIDDKVLFRTHKLTYPLYGPDGKPLMKHGGKGIGMVPVTETLEVPITGHPEIVVSEIGKYWESQGWNSEYSDIEDDWQHSAVNATRGALGQVVSPVGTFLGKGAEYLNWPSLQEIYAQTEIMMRLRDIFDGSAFTDVRRSVYVSTTRGYSHELHDYRQEAITWYERQPVAVQMMLQIALDPLNFGGVLTRGVGAIGRTYTMYEIGKGTAKGYVFALDRFLARRAFRDIDKPYTVRADRESAINQVHTVSKHAWLVPLQAAKYDNLELLNGHLASDASEVVGIWTSPKRVREMQEARHEFLRHLYNSTVYGSVRDMMSSSKLLYFEDKAQQVPSALGSWTRYIALRKAEPYMMAQLYKQEQGWFIERNIGIHDFYFAIMEGHGIPAQLIPAVIRINQLMAKQIDTAMKAMDTDLRDAIGAKFVDVDGPRARKSGLKETRYDGPRIHDAPDVLEFFDNLLRELGHENQTYRYREVPSPTYMSVLDADEVIAVADYAGNVAANAVKSAVLHEWRSGDMVTSQAKMEADADAAHHQAAAVAEDWHQKVPANSAEEAELVKKAEKQARENRHEEMVVEEAYRAHVRRIGELEQQLADLLYAEPDKGWLSDAILKGKTRGHFGEVTPEQAGHDPQTMHMSGDELVLRTASKVISRGASRARNKFKSRPLVKGSEQTGNAATLTYFQHLVRNAMLAEGRNIDQEFDPRVWNDIAMTHIGDDLPPGMKIIFHETPTQPTAAEKEAGARGWSRRTQNVRTKNGENVLLQHIYAPNPDSLFTLAVAFHEYGHAMASGAVVWKGAKQIEQARLYNELTAGLYAARAFRAAFDHLNLPQNLYDTYDAILANAFAINFYGTADRAVAKEFFESMERWAADLKSAPAGWTDKEISSFLGWIQKMDARIATIGKGEWKAANAPPAAKRPRAPRKVKELVKAQATEAEMLAAAGVRTDHESLDALDTGTLDLRKNRKPGKQAKVLRAHSMIGEHLVLPGRVHGKVIDAFVGERTTYTVAHVDPLTGEVITRSDVQAREVSDAARRYKQLTDSAPKGSGRTGFTKPVEERVMIMRSDDPLAIDVYDPGETFFTGKNAYLPKAPNGQEVGVTSYYNSQGIGRNVGGTSQHYQVVVRTSDGVTATIADAIFDSQVAAMAFAREVNDGVQGGANAHEIGQWLMKGNRMPQRGEQTALDLGTNDEAFMPIEPDPRPTDLPEPRDEIIRQAEALLRKQQLWDYDDLALRLDLDAIESEALRRHLLETGAMEPGVGRAIRSMLHGPAGKGRISDDVIDRAIRLVAGMQSVSASELRKELATGGVKLTQQQSDRLFESLIDRGVLGTDPYAPKPTSPGRKARRGAPGSRETTRGGYNKVWDENEQGTAPGQLRAKRNPDRGGSYEPRVPMHLLTPEQRKLVRSRREVLITATDVERYVPQREWKAPGETTNSVGTPAAEREVPEFDPAEHPEGIAPIAPMGPLSLQEQIAKARRGAPLDELTENHMKKLMAQWRRYTTRAAKDEFLRDNPLLVEYMALHHPDVVPYHQLDPAAQIRRVQRNTWEASREKIAAAQAKRTADQEEFKRLSRERRAERADEPGSYTPPSGVSGADVTLSEADAQALDASRADEGSSVPEPEFKLQHPPRPMTEEEILNARKLQAAKQIATSKMRDDAEERAAVSSILRGPGQEVEELSIEQGLKKAIGYALSEALGNEGLLVTTANFDRVVSRLSKAGLDLRHKDVFAALVKALPYQHPQVRAAFVRLDKSRRAAQDALLKFERAAAGGPDQYDARALNALSEEAQDAINLNALASDDLLTAILQQTDSVTMSKIAAAAQGEYVKTTQAIEILKQSSVVTPEELRQVTKPWEHQGAKPSMIPTSPQARRSGMEQRLLALVHRTQAAALKGFLEMAPQAQQEANLVSRAIGQLKRDRDESIKQLAQHKDALIAAREKRRADAAKLQAFKLRGDGYVDLRPTMKVRASTGKRRDLEHAVHDEHDAWSYAHGERPMRMGPNPGPSFDITDPAFLDKHLYIDDDAWLQDANGLRHYNGKVHEGHKMRTIPPSYRPVTSLTRNEVHSIYAEGIASPAKLLRPDMMRRYGKETARPPEAMVYSPRASNGKWYDGAVPSSRAEAGLPRHMAQAIHENTKSQLAAGGSGADTQFIEALARQHPYLAHQIMTAGRNAGMSAAARNYDVARDAVGRELLPHTLANRKMFWDSITYSTTIGGRILYYGLLAPITVWKIFLLTVPGSPVPLMNIEDDTYKRIIEGGMNPKHWVLVRQGMRPINALANFSAEHSLRLAYWLDAQTGTKGMYAIHNMFQWLSERSEKVLTALWEANNIPYPDELKRVGNLMMPSLGEPRKRLRDGSPMQNTGLEWRDRLKRARELYEDRIPQSAQRRPLEDSAVWMKAYTEAFVTMSFHMSGQMPQQVNAKGAYKAFYSKSLKMNLAHGMDQVMAQRHAMRDALDHVSLFLFDPNDIRVWESNLQLLFPFWTYWRKNTPYWGGKLFTQPWIFSNMARLTDFNADPALDEINDSSTNATPAETFKDPYARYFDTTELLDPVLNWLGIHPVGGAGFAPSSMMSVKTLYNLMFGGTLNPSLPPDRGGLELVNRIISVFDAAGLGINPYLRAGLSATDALQAESWRTIFPQTSVIDGLFREFWTSRYPDGLNLERFLLDPLYKQFHEGDMAGLDEKRISYLVSMEMTRQHLEGRPVDQEVAERDVRGFLGVAALVTLVGGPFIRRMSFADHELSRIRAQQRANYDLLPFDKKAATVLDRERSYGAEAQARIAEAFPWITLYYRLGDYKQRNQLLREHPEIAPYVQRTNARAFYADAHRERAARQVRMRDTILSAQAGVMSKIYAGLKEGRWDTDFRQTVYNAMLTPALRDYFARHATPQKEADDFIRAEYYGYMVKQTKAFHEIPETDYDARRAYMAKNPDLADFWHRTDPYDEATESILKSANASYREWYFAVVDGEGFDAAAPILRAHPQMFDFTDTESKVDRATGQWLPKNLAAITEHARDYKLMKPLLDGYFNLPKGKAREAYVEAHPDLKNYFKKYGQDRRFRRRHGFGHGHRFAGAGAPWAQVRAKFWHDFFAADPEKRLKMLKHMQVPPEVFAWGPTNDSIFTANAHAFAWGETERREAYKQIAGLMNLYFELDPDDRPFFLRLNPEIAEYFAAYRTKSLTGDKKLDKVIEKYFSLGSREQKFYIDEHPELEKWFKSRRKTKEERAIGVLLDAYFALPYGEARERYLFRTPELAGYFDEREDQADREKAIMQRLADTDPRWLVYKDSERYRNAQAQIILRRLALMGPSMMGKGVKLVTDTERHLHPELARTARTPTS